MIKTTKRDWLHFATGFVCGVLMCTAVNTAQAYNPYPTKIVAATLILEAGGEYHAGAMEAVHEVIYNRAIKRKLTMAEVCLQKWQFSCWNDQDVAANIVKAKNHPRWAEAMEIIQSNITNYTNGADHYHADYIDEPYWTEAYKRTTQIGRHIFYK